MRLRWIAVSIIVLCLIGGLASGIYARAIEASLTTQPVNPTLPVARHKTPSTPSSPAKSPVPGNPTPPAATTTPLPAGVSVLAHDTFQRGAQVFWGTASDGHSWSGDANSIEIFSIAQKSGLIAAGKGAFNAILGPTNTDSESVVSATINHFPAGGLVNLGVALRWTDGNDWYKALINGTQLQILSRVHGTSKVLATIPFAAHDALSYTLRFHAQGANLLAKAWQTGQPEPANWLLQTTDTALAQGMGGIRVLLQNTTTIRVTSFLETTVGATV